MIRATLTALAALALTAAPAGADTLRCGDGAYRDALSQRDALTPVHKCVDRPGAVVQTYRRMNSCVVRSQAIRLLKHITVWPFGWPIIGHEFSYSPWYGYDGCRGRFLAPIPQPSRR